MNPLGFTVDPEPNWVQGRRKGSKKIPSLRIGRLGIFTRMHPSQSFPRRPPCEEYPSRFSDSRIFLILAPSHPKFLEGQWLAASFVPEYSGGSVPDFLCINRSYGVPFSWILRFNCSPLAYYEIFCQVFSSKKSYLIQTH